MKLKMQISASQIKTFNLCRKKWYFEKVEKLPQGPPSYGAVFGSVLHSCLERLHKGEDPFPAGWSAPLKNGDTEVAKSLIDLYEPTEGIEERNVERKISLPVIDDISLLGYIDLYKPGTIIDHKTSKAWKWALSARELARDLQMMVYARWALEQEPDLETVELRHNVFLRTPPARYKKTVAYATSEAVMDQWYQVQETALLMKEARKGGPPEIEMGNQCHAFGGCPFARICSGVVSLEEFKGRAGEKESEMSEREIPKVTLYIGCFPTKRAEGETYLSLDAVFMEVLKERGQTLSDYTGSHAFDRRDEIAGCMGSWLAGLKGPVHITAPSTQGQVPDEKNLVFAIRLYASTIIEASA